MSFEAFSAVEMRVGLILRAEPNEAARNPAYKLWIDFGEFGVKTSSAQITDLYPAEGLVGRRIVGVMNLGSRRIAGFTSEVLVLGACDEEGRVVLLDVASSVPLGARIH